MRLACTLLCLAKMPLVYFVQVGYLIRTMPPAITMPMLEKFDDAVLHAV